MHSQVKGLVVRAVDYKDSDRILTVLSGERGLVTVSARGARRKNSRLLAASQLFAYSEMALFERAGRFYLDDADVLEQFRGLSRDIEAMALASYFAEVLGAEAEENAPHPDVLRLALNALHALSAGTFELRAVKSAFELRYASLAGWLPDLGECAVCGGALAGGGRFEPVSGQIRCGKCRGTGHYSPLDTPALAAARYIISAGVSRVFSFRLESSSMELLSSMSESYLLSCMEREFKTLRFYKSLQTDGTNNESY